jgi:diguanylate cyclase (GGDEF)-like protein
MQSVPLNGPRLGRGSLIHLQHPKGHDIPAIMRRVVLRDGLGKRIGAAAVFHPAEHMSALPHGETSEGYEVQESQIEMRDRLEAEFEAFEREGVPLGVLWITVDQGPELRKTHGAKACEAMLESVERVLANASRPGEELGRWGDDEFLMLSHQLTGEALAKHAQVLAGLARTAVFRWWGDRVSLTVSVGAAEADKGEDLPQLLARARTAMETSVHQGGNHITLAPGR